MSYIYVKICGCHVDIYDIYVYVIKSPQYLAIICFGGTPQPSQSTDDPLIFR